MIGWLFMVFVNGCCHVFIVVLLSNCISIINVFLNPFSTGVLSNTVAIVIPNACLHIRIIHVFDGVIFHATYNKGKS